MPRNFARPLLLTGVSLPLALWSSVAAAQTVPTPPTEESEAAAQTATQEVIVTGSRVQRDGYDAPTPLTVVDASLISKSAPTNVANYLNQLPQLTGTATSRAGNGATSTGTAGLNLLDLRGLGSNRTLVLIDGQRVAPSTQTGAVDVNNIPTALLSRVDIVTGGASAAYGSDAVAGVVNFVIDRKFEGVKLNVMGGVTSRGDNKNYQFTGSFGKAFADGRGHVIVSGEHQHEDGIFQIDPAKRKWYRETYLVTNPAFVAGNGQPRQIVADNVHYNNVAQGTVINSVVQNGVRRNFITSGALTNTTNPFFGTSFGAGGAVTPFVYGTIAGNFMIGGNPWNEGNFGTLTPRIDRTNGWGMLSYEFSPAVTATIEASYGKTHTVGPAAYQRNVNNIDVSANNAFLPASVRATAAANNITSFRVGYGSVDLGRMVNDIERENYRVVGTLAGELGQGWKWQAYYQYGRTNLDIKLLNTTDNIKFSNAIDAVTNASGQIVCRSTLTNPNDGCVPLNIFGTGVASPAAIAYVKGTASQTQAITQKVGSLSITGEPFDLWAGPVSFAAGVERRSESVTAVGDPVSATFVSGPALYPTTLGGFFTGNFKSNAGKYTVTEGFAEVVVPLLKDSGIGTADFNGAARITDYSTSGRVTTWKAGVTYEPIRDIKFRVVRSRDIRAPNLQELYAAGASQAVDVTDPLATVNPTRITQITDGNRALRPEKANTLGLGVVVSPRFLPGFSASFDYYNIKLSDAITTLAVNDIVARCIGGESELCALITRNAAGTITEIRRVPVNVASQRVRGFDIDASYRVPFDGLFRDAAGNIVLRFLANRALNYSFTNNNVTNEAVGENGGPNAAPSIPKWRTFTSLGYDSDQASLTLTMRTISAGVYDVTWVSGVDIDRNYIAGAKYFDLGGNYTLFGQGRNKTELYFAVENLFDKDPPVAAGNASSTPPFNPVLYDGIGRSYRVGVRARF